MYLLKLKGKYAVDKYQFSMIDEEDEERANEHSWRIFIEFHNKRNGIRVPYNKPKETVKSDIKGRTVSLHRFIMYEPHLSIVDHLDNDRLNNQKSNLRIATQSQNNINIDRNPGSSSQYRGVRKTENGKFSVSISVNKKKYHIGTYESEIEAALVYNEIAVKYHQEFARLNVIEEEYQFLPVDDNPF